MVKWIRLSTDMFDNRKIKYIRSSYGNDPVLVWVMLLTIAGKSNDGGRLMLTPSIPYDTGMLADELGFSCEEMDRAIDALVLLDMIVEENGALVVRGWEEHQNAEGLERIREQTRERVAKYREKKKEFINGEFCAYCGAQATGYDHIIPTSRGGQDVDSNKVPCCKECNSIKNNRPLYKFLNENRDRIRDDLIAQNPKLLKFVTLSNEHNRYIVTQCNATEEDKEIDIDKDISIESIVADFNAICKSFAKVKSISDARRKTIRARLNTYTPEQVHEVFEKAEASAFLKGKNAKSWIATFDWLMKDANFAKVLDGNYDDRDQKKTTAFNNFHQRKYDYESLEAKLLGEEK